MVLREGVTISSLLDAASGVPDMTHKYRRDGGTGTGWLSGLSSEAGVRDMDPGKLGTQPSQSSDRKTRL